MAATVLLFGCADNSRKQASGFTQGTTYSVSYFSNGTDIQYQIDSLLLAFDRVLSTYQESSYISKWNRNEVDGMDQPQMFKEVVKRAIEVNQASDRALDITVSPLMSYWFGKNWNTAHIDSAAVDSIVKHVGMNLIQLEGTDYVKVDSSVQLDVNAIAQGYSVDVVCRYLESFGIFNYLVEIGGEVRASGTKENDAAWSVGIDAPTEGDAERTLLLSVELKDAALATSGNYRKFIEVDGQKLGHSLNPKTGYPAKTDVLSATIIAPDCMTADAFATACMVMGVEKSKELIRTNSNLEGILIYSSPDGPLTTWDSRTKD